jgi:hypothetical protein
MIQPITIVQGDYGYQIPFTLEDGNGAAVSLSGATLAMKVQSYQDPTAVLALTGAMTIDSASAGTCHYTVANGDFPTPGKYLVQITATFNTEVLSWSGLQIVVMPSLPENFN